MPTKYHYQPQPALSFSTPPGFSSPFRVPARSPKAARHRSAGLLSSIDCNDPPASSVKLNTAGNASSAACEYLQAPGDG